MTTYTTSSGPWRIALVDVNIDTKPDIVVANRDSSNVGVFLNAGSGTFSGQTTYTTGSSSFPDALAVADINSDNLPDIVVGLQSTSKIGILLNAGSGTFGAITAYTAGVSPEGMAVADVNGDSKPDVIASGNNVNSVTVLLHC
ncbi:unnamed protein product [Adineta steineri]|uniref:VCBS repeat-containing protein n=1 Tax=Adineta steineri TaxID=433720 RepID=A0A814XPT2_9BILA|nr:unnamed protein product [Adineta steineri]